MCRFFLKISASVRIALEEREYLSHRSPPSVRITVVGGADNDSRSRHAHAADCTVCLKARQVDNNTIKQ